MKILLSLILSLGLVQYSSCGSTTNHSSENPTYKISDVTKNDSLSLAYFAGGCFWCVEAVYESVRGVQEVISGYSGGTKEDASYEKVGRGLTDHAESVAVIYDPHLIDYRTLVEVFFASTDPTTLNRQGPDQGRQYRSIIFYETEEQKKIATSYIKELEDEKVFSAPIVVEVTKFNSFYPAEDYHQNYEKNHPENPYVQAVSLPRLRRFQEKRPDLLKENH